jgi:hypothetical protein
LGFPIKLKVLDAIFKKNPEFECEYLKDMSKYVRISLAIKMPPELESHVRRKTEKPHKFIIYRTGSVTESGPHPVVNEIAYNKFIEVIVKNLDLLKA